MEKGGVTLTGEVDWQFQRTDAEYAVHKLTGVTHVANQILVASAVHASEIREKIQNALQRSRGRSVADHGPNRRRAGRPQR